MIDWLKSHLADDWREVWKHYSAWALAIIAGLPDLWHLLLASGLLSAGDMPDALAWIIRGLAIAGIVGKFVKQKRPK